METVVHTMARWGLKGGVALTGWHDKQPCSVWQVPAERDLSYSTYDRWAMENILCQAWCGPPTPKKVMQEHPERFSEKKNVSILRTGRTAADCSARHSQVFTGIANIEQQETRRHPIYKAKAVLPPSDEPPTFPCPHYIWYFWVQTGQLWKHSGLTDEIMGLFGNEGQTTKQPLKNSAHIPIQHFYKSPYVISVVTIFSWAIWSIGHQITVLIMIHLLWGP